MSESASLSGVQRLFTAHCYVNHLAKRSICELPFEHEMRRVVYEGKACDLQPSEQRKIPIMDIELLARLRKLGTDREWVFQSRNRTPINPCNARRRFLKPAAQELGIPCADGVISAARSLQR